MLRSKEIRGVRAMTRETGKKDQTGPSEAPNNFKHCCRDPHLDEGWQRAGPAVGGLRHPCTEALDVLAQLGLAEDPLGGEVLGAQGLAHYRLQGQAHPEGVVAHEQLRAVSDG